MDSHVLVKGLLRRESSAADTTLYGLVWPRSETGRLRNLSQGGKAACYTVQLTSCVNLHVTFDFASLGKAGIPRAFVPSTSKTTVHLLDMFQVVVLAMFLQLLIIVKALTTDSVPVADNPATEKRIVVHHDL